MSAKRKNWLAIHFAMEMSVVKTEIHTALSIYAVYTLYSVTYELRSAILAQCSGYRRLQFIHF